jgi:hypothetical protein
MNKELIVSRIISGTLRLEGGYTLKNPTAEATYVANEIAEQANEDGVLSGAISDAEAVKMLYDQGLWDFKQEELLQRIPKDIEDFKVKLFECVFKSVERKAIKELIAKAKEKLLSLLTMKSSFNHLTYNYQANLLKSKFLIFSSVYYKGKKLFQDEVDIFWDLADSDLIERVLHLKNEASLGETEFRELARTDPWRSYWSLKKDTLFGIPVINYTDEQRSICAWSSLYDSVYEHPKCPSDEVIKDDDMMDGWMIIQRRERNKHMEAEDIVTNEKIRNSDEVYIPAQTKEDARKVDDLNSPHVKQIKQNRFTFLAKVGEAKHGEFPDVKREIGMQANRMEADARR